MTKSLLIILGLLFIFTGLAAPYESLTIWSAFLSTSSIAAILRDLLGLFMITYAVIPTVRTIFVRKVLALFAIALSTASIVGFWHNSMLVIDLFICLSASIFGLLGSLELESDPNQKPFSYYLKPNARLPKIAKIRRAH